MNEPRSRTARYRSFCKEFDCMRVHTLKLKNEESAKQSFERSLAKRLICTRVRIT